MNLLSSLIYFIRCSVASFQTLGKSSLLKPLSRQVMFSPNFTYLLKCTFWLPSGFLGKVMLSTIGLVVVLGAIVKPNSKVRGAFQNPLVYLWLDADSFERSSLASVYFGLRARLAFCCLFFFSMGSGSQKILDFWMWESIDFIYCSRL